MLDGEQDHLLKLFFGLFKTTDVLPLDVRHLDVSFSEGGGVDRSHGKFEVFLVDGHSLQDLCVYLFGLDIDNVHLFSDALKGGLSAERCHIRTNKTVGVFGDCFKIYSFIEFHVFGVDSEDFETTDLVRDTNIYFSVETAEPSEGGIERVGSVGSSNDNDVSSGLETVH